jgi:hypothetical protein
MQCISASASCPDSQLCIITSLNFEFCSLISLSSWVEVFIKCQYDSTW